MSLFGTYLKHCRTEQGLTLRSIAESVGVDPSYLSRLERGEVANPADEVLDRLPAILNRQRDEVYLAAGRITPELSAVLEQGLPYTLQQAAPLLAMLRDQLGGMFSELGGVPLADLMSPTDANTMANINAAMTHVAELVQAIEKGQITEEQFAHITETIRQLKLSVLTRHEQEKTP